ncbi:MAG: peptidoglycan DD-metalloendopeptidase family protein [Hyphomicrobiales bacterium]
MTLALLAVTFAARFPDASNAQRTVSVPTFALSGVTGSPSAHAATYFRPGTSHQTHESVAALTARSDVASVRAAGGVSPISSFTAGVAAAAVDSGEQGAGVQPLADIVDPRKPFVLYETMAGDTVSGIAEKFGIQLRTLLDNNPTVGDGEIILQGQQLVVPRKDGILHKVGYGETVDSIVAQYDNITAATVIDYRPNAITDPSQLEVGRYLLLPGATVKPPPPPPPPEERPAPPPSSPSGGGGNSGGGGSPRPGGSGRFSFPLAAWHGISDPFGVARGGGTYHTGIDLDLWGFHHVSIFAACDGTVVKTEYLTYSYGYHVVIDCGDGFSTLYAHMDRIDVSPGQYVSAGTPLGISGLTGFTTGEHLHFEIRINGAPVNPADYLPF